MYVIDKTFSLLVVQSLLAVYLLNVYNEARLERKGNILDQWNGKAKLKVGDKKVDDGSENTFQANMFKKFYRQDGDAPNELKETEFYNFIEDFMVFVNTFLIVLAFGVMFTFFVCYSGKHWGILIRQKPHMSCNPENSMGVKALKVGSKVLNCRVQTVMNVQHGGFKFFVIFIVTWTILSDQKKF